VRDFASSGLTSTLPCDDNYKNRPKSRITARVSLGIVLLHCPKRGCKLLSLHAPPSQVAVLPSPPILDSICAPSSGVQPRCHPIVPQAQSSSLSAYHLDVSAGGPSRYSQFRRESLRILTTLADTLRVTPLLYAFALTLSSTSNSGGRCSHQYQHPNHHTMGRNSTYVKGPRIFDGRALLGW
jgi:hypothetical protein